MIYCCENLNLSFVSVETEWFHSDLAVVYKQLCQFVVFGEDWKLADDVALLFE